MAASVASAPMPASKPNGRSALPIKNPLDTAYSNSACSAALFSFPWRPKASSSAPSGDTGIGSLSNLERMNLADSDIEDFKDENSSDELPPDSAAPQENSIELPTATIEQLARGDPVTLGGQVQFVEGKVTHLPSTNLEPTEEEPHIDPKASGRLVQTLHLAYSNQFEIASQDRKSRRRALEKFRGYLGAELDDELRKLSCSISSVSTISVQEDHSKPSSAGAESICGPECWLRDGLPVCEPIVGGKYSIPFFEDPFFRYKPIQPGQTRILCLAPGTVEEPLTMQILPMNKHDSGSYEALSYTWGSSKPSKISLLNGRLFVITETLYQALMYLRRSDQPRWLWVDALCINQESPAEKSLQIPMMTSIYRNATRVVVWMGEHANHSELAIAGMKYLDMENNRKKLFHQKHETECHKRLRMLYESLLEFYRRPWFRRTWVRQELTVARKVIVQCGQDTISWYTVKKAAKRLPFIQQRLTAWGVTDLAPIDRNSIEYLECLKRGWRYGQSAMGFLSETGSLYYYHGGGLLELLMISRAYDATDPRDKVYGVLGLSREPIEGGSTTDTTALPDSEKQAARFVVDYSQTVSQVYQHVAKYLINRDRNLDVLCILSTHRGLGSADLPSWVPDWRVPKEEIHLTDCWDYIGMKHAAAIAAPAELQEQDGGGRLAVRLLILDRITVPLDVTGDVCNAINIAHFAGEDEDKIGAETKPFVPGKDVRRFCATEGISHCLAPAAAQEGDLVVLMCGGRLPFVIRPRSWDDCADDEAGSTVMKERADVELLGPCFHPYLTSGAIFEELLVDYPSPPRVFIV